MRRLLGAWLFLTVLLAAALLFARLLAPGRFELELDVFILVVGALARASTSWSRRARPFRARGARRSPRRSTATRPRPSARPSSTGSSAS